MGEAQNFIRGLCQVFGLSHRRAVRFEERVAKLGGKRGRIDGFLPGLLLVEMKSTGADLDKAYVQASEYFPGLKDEDLSAASEGECVLSQSFRAAFMRVCQPRPEPLNASNISGSRRIAVKTIGFAETGRPRRSKGLTNSHSSSVRGNASGSDSAAAVMAASSSGVGRMIVRPKRVLIA